MQNTLIALKTAKKAKEVGFDVDCGNYWVETLEHTLDIPRNGEGVFPDHEPRILSFKPIEDYHIIHGSAPTQSLLQKYLREAHNINVLPCPVLGKKNGYDSYPFIGWRYDILLLNKGTKNSYFMGYPILEWFAAESLEEDETLKDLNIDRFDTFEEALEEGLYEALLKIENNGI